MSAVDDFRRHMAMCGRALTPSARLAGLAASFLPKSGCCLVLASPVSARQLGSIAGVARNSINAAVRELAAAGCVHLDDRGRVVSLIGDTPCGKPCGKPVESCGESSGVPDQGQEVSRIRDMRCPGSGTEGVPDQGHEVSRIRDTAGAALSIDAPPLKGGRGAPSPTERVPVVAAAAAHAREALPAELLALLAERIPEKHVGKWLDFSRRELSVWKGLLRKHGDVLLDVVAAQACFEQRPHNLISKLFRDHSDAIEDHQRRGAEIRAGP